MVEVTNTMGAPELQRKYLESPAGSDLLAEMVKMAAVYSDMAKAAWEMLRCSCDQP